MPSQLQLVLLDLIESGALLTGWVWTGAGGAAPQPGDPLQDPNQFPTSSRLLLSSNGSYGAAQCLGLGVGRRAGEWLGMGFGGTGPHQWDPSWLGPFQLMPTQLQRLPIL
jgi:hypothetical protein